MYRTGAATGIRRRRRPPPFGGDRRRAVLDGLIRVPQLAAELLRPLATTGLAHADRDSADQVTAERASAEHFSADESDAAAGVKGASRVAV